MNYGLYLSAAGALTNLHRQDVLANNLANVNTVGFKPDDVFFRTRLPERLESDSLNALADPQWLLEQLGGGTFADPTMTNFRQSDLSVTGNDLDLAMQGDGFFVVSNGKRGTGANANDHLRFTRDGRFTRNAAGELIMAATGMRVMDVNNQPIRLASAGKVRIDGDGSITQNGAPVARLQISTVSDKRALTKEGDNVLRIVTANTKRQAATGQVRQGHIESSGVDPIVAMNNMINASKAVAANITMMQYHDNIIGQAVNTFGRVT